MGTLGPTRPELEPGEALAIRLASGGWVAVEVVAREQYAGTMAVVYLLAWSAPRPPTAPEAAALPRAETRHGVIPWLLGAATRRDRPDPRRVLRLGRVRAAEPDARGRAVVTWKFLDRQLAELFGLR